MNLNEKPIILAVDDDTVILNTVMSTLGSEYNIIPFTFAKAALKYLESKTADLILLDYHMPEMDGFEMLKIVHNDEKLKEIPVIFLTGAVGDDSEADALHAGAVDYIGKPIRPQVLLTRVEVQLELLAHRKDLEKIVQEKTRGLNQALTLLKKREDVTLNLLARVTELRDSETGTHIERTTEFTKIIVNELLKNPIEGYHLTPEAAEDIIKSAKLHDIGKISIPDDILLKPGKLDPHEFEIIKKHTHEGKKLLSDTMGNIHSGDEASYTEEEADYALNDDNFLKTAHDIAFSHHEKWNGNGYPRGLSKMDIPLAARIVAIADVYDALTSERPYKKPFSSDESFDIIMNDSGEHFDPLLVEIFKKHADKFKKISNS